MRLVLPLFLVVCCCTAQTPLQEQIRKIADEAMGRVSVACALPASRLSCDLNATAHPSMQSVFKLPLAMAVLDRVERGSLLLDQPVHFLPSDRIPKAYSPLQDKFPKADVDLSLRELLQYAVRLSDNVAADMLLRLLEGPESVNSYMRSIGVRGFHLEDGERTLHREIAAQYRNWFEPAGAVQLLRRLSDDSPLSAEHTKLLFSWMEYTTIAKRLKAGVPDGTTVLHKSGTSDVDNGLAHATNDIGLIKLPDGRFLALAVFVTDSTADEATREGVIARIARAAYNAASAP